MSFFYFILMPILLKSSIFALSVINNPSDPQSMKKIEFYEVNFGENQLLPLMTAKCFSSHVSAQAYAMSIKDKLIKKLDSLNTTLVDVDCRINDGCYGDKVYLLVFSTMLHHLEIFEIKIIRHTYQLED